MKFESIDEYLGTLEATQREALQKLRTQIVSAAPTAEECFSYGIPAFRQGKVVCGFAAMKNHCGFYVFDGDTVAAFADDLEGYDVSKGTIRFQPEDGLPDELVQKIVKARLAEIAGD